MGCDIHMRVFLNDGEDAGKVDVTPRYDYITGKYVPSRLGLDFEPWTDRSYKFFGIMGNGYRDGSFDRMECLVDGTPDCFEELYKKEAGCSDYYGFVYAGFDSLYGGYSDLSKRLSEELRNKSLWGVGGNFSSSLNRYRTDNRCMIDYLKRILKTMDGIRKSMKGCEFKMRCELEGIGNVSESDLTFVFFFDC